MITIIFIIIIVYVNLIRYLELRELTNVYTLKDYINYDNKIVLAYNYVFIWLYLWTQLYIHIKF